MRRFVKGLPLFLLIMIMLGGCGRMSANNPENEILSYLRDRHGEEFRVLRLTEENSGGEGRFLRAVCRSESIGEPFVLCCYRDPSCGEETAEIGGVTVGVRDEYANLRLQDAYARALRASLPEAVFVGCRLDTSGRCYTPEEADGGLEACAQLSEVRAVVMLFVITDGPESAEELLSRADPAPSALPFYRQYVYFGRSARSEAYWEEQFAENYDRFDYLFLRSGLVVDPITFEIPAE